MPEIIGKILLSCARGMEEKNLFSSYASGTRAIQYYNGGMRTVQDKKEPEMKD